jgi:YebC/PmpR family DNA-binding regulatory protein
MSGHSHAKTVAATKNANDAKKGKIYSKYGRLITIAVKEGGGSGDPVTNSKLKTAIEQAKAMNMPKENIERAIKKGTGELAGEVLETVSYEGFGPGGVALIIEGITDNKNRTLGEVKQILNQYGGKMAGEGAVRWMFEQKGIIKINNEQAANKESLEMTAIEAGADDIVFRDSQIEIYTKPEDIESVKKNLEEKGLKASELNIELVPKDSVSVDQKTKNQCQNLFDALDENEAVQNIYSNLKE